MPTVKALTNTPFGVGIRAKGEVFEATEHEAKLLVALRRAVIVEPEKAQKVEKTETAKNTEVATKDLVAKEKPADDPKKDVKAPKGKYNRRDMKASK